MGRSMLKTLFWIVFVLKHGALGGQRKEVRELDGNP